MKQKIIIEYDDIEHSAGSAIAYVSIVVAKGKVSTCESGDHFCWATTWHDGTVVWVRRKKSATSADSMCVYRDRGTTT